MLNKMQVIGFAGSDPEMRYTPSGNPVTSFTIAVNRRYQDNMGNNQEETEWFRVVCWNRLAESVNNYAHRGGKYYVEGRLRSNTWQGQDGQMRFTNEVVANQVIFLDPARQTVPVSAYDPAYGGEPNVNPQVNGHGTEPVVAGDNVTQQPPQDDDLPI